jgi:glycine hydroxymethyltransferase
VRERIKVFKIEEIRMKDFLFRGPLSDVDASVYELIKLESERQFRKLILIPSETSAPVAVREALGSVYQNIYAEGYPREETRWMSEEEILDFPAAWYIFAVMLIGAIIRA